MELFKRTLPETAELPILISSPHSGIGIPDELKNHYNPQALELLDDTDWFIPQLYQFAPAKGIHLIEARLHRWVIDLNRNPKNESLYNDGRLITGLCSTTDFIGNAIYNPGFEPDQQEIDRRLITYYWPYYQEIEKILAYFIQKFGVAVLYDAHSIRSVVPTIQKERFPDIIIGTADGKSANPELIESVLATFTQSSYEISYNKPFKGGHITRYFGNPSQGIHAIQVERCKDLYMDENERNLDMDKAQIMSELLENVFEQIIQFVKNQK